MVVVKASEYRSMQNNEITHPERCDHVPKFRYIVADKEDYQRYFFDFDKKPDNKIDSVRCADMPKKREQVIEDYQAEFYKMPKNCKTVSVQSRCAAFNSLRSNKIEYEEHQLRFFTDTGSNIADESLCTHMPSTIRGAVRTNICVVRLSDINGILSKESYHGNEALSEALVSVAAVTSSSAAAAASWTKNELSKLGEKWKTMSQKAKIRFIAIASALVIALAGGITALSIAMSPANRIVRYINEADFAKANEVFYRNYSNGENTDRLEEKLCDLIVSIKEEFLSEEVSYEESMSKLYAIDNFNLSDIWDEVSSAQQFLYDVNQSMIAYRNGVSFFENGDYLSAIYELRNVIPDDPHYASGQEYLLDAENAYRDVQLAAAEEEFNNGNLMSAIAILRDALVVIPDDPQMSSVFESYIAAYKAEKIAEAEALASEGDYIYAISVLDGLVYDIGEDDEVITLIDHYALSYENHIAECVNSSMGLREYSEALDYAYEGLDNLPYNVFLQSLCDYLQENLPIKFSANKPVSSTSCSLTGNTVTDIHGNEYQGDNLYIVSAYDDDWGSSTSGYIKFDTDGLSKLDGFVAVEECADEANALFEILADSTVVYSREMTSTSRSISISELDVSGCSTVTVRLTFQTGDVDVILKDFVIYNVKNIDGFLTDYVRGEGYFEQRKTAIEDISYD